MSIDCIVRKTYYLGSLICHRINCPFYLNNKRHNNTYFHGYLDYPASKGFLVVEDRTSINCHYCKKIVTCADTCECMVHYVLPQHTNMMRAMIHVGKHLHNV